MTQKNGKVKSYLTQKGYGFIRGEDEKDYFFHRSGLDKTLKESEVKEGMTVCFEGKPVPKGYQAFHISESRSFEKEIAIDFYHSRRGAPEWMNIHSSLEMKTRFFKNPEEAKEHLVRMANNAGANAILNMKYEKKTFADGNYKYSMHSYSSLVCYATKKGYTPVESESKTTKAYAQSKAKDFGNQANSEQKAEDIVIHGQLNPPSPSLTPLWVFLWIFALIILGMAVS